MNHVGSARRVAGEHLGCEILCNESPTVRGRQTTIQRPKFGIAAGGRWGDTGEMEEVYEDLDLLESVANNIANVDTMTWNTICVFGIAVSWPAVSYLRKFRPEFEAAIREGELVTLPVEEATVPPEENYAYQQRIVPSLFEA